MQLACCIGLDIMGGETPPHTLFKEFFLATHNIHIPCHFTLFVDSDTFIYIQNTLKQCDNRLIHTYSCVVCETHISLTASPLRAVKNNSKSTMATSLRYLKSDAIDALISVGNTGALIAGSTFFIGTTKRGLKVALMATLTTPKSTTYCLDVGARVMPSISSFSHSALEACKFAYTKTSQPIAIGILNIGIEKGKGGKYQKELFKLGEKIKSASNGIEIKSVQNIESRHIFDGNIDVVLTEGFSGNIFIKTIEAAFDTSISMLRNHGIEVPQSLSYYGEEGRIGAQLLGLKKKAYKCHASSCGKSIAATAYNAAFNYIKQ